MHVHFFAFFHRLYGLSPNRKTSLADTKPREGTQTADPEHNDIYDDQLFDTLECKIAYMSNASIADNRSHIRSCKPQDGTATVENSAFGSKSAAGAMLVFADWVKSARFDLTQSLDTISSDLVRTWQDSLDFRTEASCSDAF